jgi:hypothetical protein
MNIQTALNTGNFWTYEKLLASYEELYTEEFVWKKKSKIKETKIYDKWRRLFNWYAQ